MTPSRVGTKPRFCIVLGQRASWPELLGRAQETEALGFDGLFLVDHFYGLVDVDDPTHEAYTMLAALAPFTQRLRLGVMVCGNTYRNPAFLLKQAVTVDHVSGGRVDFGVGAGWVEREHEAYGFAFPSARERVDRFAEALEIWDLLQRDERVTYLGQHYRLIDAPFAPKPLQRPRLPLLVGGSGPRMLQLAARHADAWNVVGVPADVRGVNRRMDDACRAAGRDPASLVRSVSTRLDLLASVPAFVEGVAAYRDAGFSDLYVPWPRTASELDVLRQVARDVLPELRGADSPVAPPPANARTRLRDLDEGDLETAARVVADIGDPAARRLLDFLIAHPDTRFDGAALIEPLGLDRHVEVTLAAASLAAAFGRQGLPRPWNESQLGYLLPARNAELLGRAHEAADLIANPESS